MNLKQENVQEIKHVVKNNKHYYYLTLVSRGAFCPRCGQYSRKIHGYKKEIITHSVFLTEEAVIIYRHRRYKCDCGKTFFEPCNFKSSHPKISNKTVENVCILLKQYNQTFASVARAVYLSVTEVITIFDEHIQIERHPLSEAVCMDEIYFSSKKSDEHEKYICLFLNFKNGLVLDIIKSRKKAFLISYFRSIPIEERRIVKYLIMDLNDTYKDVGKLMFPDALLCADGFHVMSNINKALDSVRKKKLKEYEGNKKSDEYYLLKHKCKLLFLDSGKVDEEDFNKNRHFRATYSSGQLLRLLLEIDEELKNAYNLKTQYELFMAMDTDKNEMKDIEKALEDIITDYTVSNIKEFVSFASTLKKWRQEILNSFTKYDGRKLSNGPLEGRNKYAKIILKLGNGYSNFKRYRNRAMYVLNKFETYSVDVLDSSKIRRKGEKRKKKNKK